MALEAQKRRLEIEKNRAPHSANGDAPRPAPGPRMTKGGGWLPSSTSHSANELDDPLLQQINNIESFLQQARAANRTDEAAMLEENLRQLQEEFDAQQMSRAIEMSQRQAQEEDLQRSQILHLQLKEAESKMTRMDSSNLGHSKNVKEHWEKEEEHGLDLETSPQHKTPSINSFPRLPGNSPPLQRENCTTTPPGEEASLNPFDEDDITPVEEDSTNPFSEEIQREQKQKPVTKPKEYNPFEESVAEEQDGDAGKKGSSRNPFEDDLEDNDKCNPFNESPDETPSASTNPFEDDKDSPALDDIIEEELLLQQIDNIRAYIFDAKHSGRRDEVELLSQNLRELQCTLQEQKRKTH